MWEDFLCGVVDVFLFMWRRGHVFCIYDAVDMLTVYVVSWTCLLFIWCRGHVFCLCGVVDMFIVYVVSWTCFLFMQYTFSRFIYTVNYY